MNANLTGLETLFLALGDKTRLRLLSLMADGPVSVGFLCDSLGDSQPKVSRHLAYMRNAGVVTARREGKHIYYGIREYEDGSLTAVLDCVLGALIGKTKAAKQVARPRTHRRRVVDEPLHASVAIPSNDNFEETSESFDSEDVYEREEEYYSDSARPVEEMDVFLL